VDLDGDGTPDIVSGSWPGQLYFFRGLGKGKFAAGQPLKDTDGKEINAGSASTVFAADWRGTGKLDLLVGCIEGFVYLIPNDGTRTKPAFGKPQKLKAAGSDIRVKHGDSHPIMADWEGTGKQGLVVGCGDGSVQWYRNVGTRKEPKLGRPVTLVSAPPQVDFTKKSKGPQRGSRAKVCVVDWNNDGRLDLLVGDFGMSVGEAPKLSAADKKRQKELEAQVKKVIAKLEPFAKEVQKAYDEAGTDRSPEVIAKRDKKVRATAQRYKKPLEERTKLFQELRKFQPPYSYHGHVWLFLRKAPAASVRR
jgi:hypothetical protein